MEQTRLIPEIGKIEAKKRTGSKRTESVFLDLLWSPRIDSNLFVPKLSKERRQTKVFVPQLSKERRRSEVLVPQLWKE